MPGHRSTHGGPEHDSFNIAARLSGRVVETLRADWARARATLDAQSAPRPTALGSLALAHGPAQTQCAHRQPNNAHMSRDVAAAVLSRDDDWRPWGGTDVNPYGPGVVALINAAEQHISIINSPIGIAHIQKARVRAIVVRRVKVFFILGKQIGQARDRRIFFGGDNLRHARALRATLPEQGGPQAVSRLRIVWGATDGLHPRPPHYCGNIYAKVTGIDDHALWKGSTRCDGLSWYS